MRIGIPIDCLRLNFSGPVLNFFKKFGQFSWDWEYKGMRLSHLVPQYHLGKLLTLRILTMGILAGACSHGTQAQEKWEKLSPTKLGSEIDEQVESHLDLTFARVDGRELKLHLYRPKKASGALPAIVCIHGGGWNKGDRRHHANIAKALAARGYVTVSIDYRLSGEARFPAHIHDCKAAVRWMRAHAEKWGIDTNLIGATGASAGGHLAALLGTSGGIEELEGEGGYRDFSSTIQASAAMGGQSDFMSERNRLKSAEAEIWQQFLGGSQDEVPDNYRLASPRTHLDAGDPAIFFLTGEFDDPSTRGDTLRHDAMALGVPTGLFVVKGAPHALLNKQESFDIALDQLDAFFTLHLKQKGVPKVTASGSVPAIQGEWKQLGGGYGGSEGPQWITVDGEPTLIYAAHHDGFVFRWSPEKGLRVWRDDSPEATSFRPDGKGGYCVVEQTTRQVTHWNEQAECTAVLADRFEGKRLNRPNDLRVHPDGSLWFTDPDFLFGLRPDEVKELEGQYIFRLDPETRELTAVVKDARKPNGIAISEDGKALFFTDSMSKSIYRAPILDDGTLGAREIFATSELFGLDGLTLDSQGRLWSAAKTSVAVYQADGALLGNYAFPSKPTAIAFHPDGWICVTTRDAAYVAQF
ncbi:SMP-30/gluconolactonase/LRE family protein [Verrucomicrobiales bacterium]|nr:SMP-30/gluconolactonase/LRE family protein [Verrucomicrobiales bacterium]